LLGSGAVNTFLQQGINAQQQRKLLEAMFSVLTAKLLQALASRIILGSESHGTIDHSDPHLGYMARINGKI
jgi:hypothetical protein